MYEPREGCPVQHQLFKETPQVLCRAKIGQTAASRPETNRTRNSPAPSIVPRGRNSRHTFATRLSAGGLADNMVTQMLRQEDAEVFKLYSQARLGMMREASARLDRKANERPGVNRFYL